MNRRNIYQSVCGRYYGQNYSTEDLIASDYIIQQMSDCGNLVGHDGCVNAISFHPLSSRSHLLITGSDDTTVRIWNIPNRKEIRKYAGHLSNVFATEFFSHRDVIVSGGNDADLRVYDIEKDNVRIYKDHHRKVLDIKLDEHHHPHCFFSCSADGTIRCFDTRKHYKNTTTTKIQRSLAFNDEEESVIPQAMGGGRYREEEEEEEEEEESDDEIEDDNQLEDEENENENPTTTRQQQQEQEQQQQRRRRRRQQRFHPLFFGKTESVIEGRKGMSSCLVDFGKDDSFVYNFDLSPNGHDLIISCQDGNIYLFDLRNLPSLRNRDDPRIKAVNVFRNVFEERCEITGCSFNYNGSEVCSMALGKAIHTFDVYKDYRNEGVDYLNIKKYKKSEELMKDEEEEEEKEEVEEEEVEEEQINNNNNNNSQQGIEEERREENEDMRDEDDDDEEEEEEEMLIPAQDFLRMLLGMNGPPEQEQEEEEERITTTPIDNNNNEQQEQQQQQQRRRRRVIDEDEEEPEDDDEIHIIEQNNNNNNAEEEDELSDEEEEDSEEVIRTRRILRRRRQRQRQQPPPPEEEEEEEPNCSVSKTFIKRFKGHYSQRTIKGIWYFGKKSEYLVCGSDDTNIYIFNSKTGELVRILEGHDDIVNTTKPHPFLPMICASGLESIVKIWEAKPPYPKKKEIEKRKKRIQEIRKKNINPPSSMSSFGLLDLLQFMILQQRQEQEQQQND